MRRVRLRSSRKFWPSDFLAAKPCAAMTSRKGGNGSCAASSAVSGIGDLGRAFDRCDHAPGIGFALARDVERRAVIGRRAHDGKPQRDVDAVPEGERLEWDQSLI